MTNPTQAFPQQEEDVFGVISGFAGYVSKPEITNLLPNYLVRGSKNVLIDYANRIISRNGYKLYNQANSSAGGIKGSYDWETSLGTQFNLRSYDGNLEFDWNATYNNLLSNLRSPYIEFAKVLDYAEQQDVLLMVLGEASMRRWSGGVSKVWKSTSSTLTKQGVLGIQLLVLGTPTMTIASPCVITLNGHGLSAGNIVQFSTTGALPTGLSAGVNYYVISAGLNSNSFEVSLTAGGTAINSTGSQSGTHTVYQVSTTNSSGITFVAGVSESIAPTILDSNNNFLNAGFAAGDTIDITGSVNNSGNFTIGSVTAGVMTLIMTDILVTESSSQPVLIYNQTGPTWKSARFFSTITGRSIVYKGTTYIYTGGENTDTLTGLQSFPTVAVGDAVWQMADTISLPPAITGPFPNFFPNLIGVQLNMVFLASTDSSMVFGSQNIDYTNFTLTDPRAAGDPSQQPLTSGPATCIIPVDTDSMILNVQNSLIFGSGIDAFDGIDFHMSADNTEELLRIIRFKTAKGAGLISKDAICPIKNNTVYISREPALDTLSQSNLENQDGRKNVPISDPIKDDFDAYDFTDTHIIYWKRAIYISLPAHGLVLIYDLMRGLWQPPQTIPVGRFSIINDWLYGHSYITNETYKLFTGTNDNGIFISQIARFAYNNGGNRFRLKNFNEYWSDGYITPNGVLAMNTYYGFAGSLGVSQTTITGTDQSVVVGVDADPLGSAPLGSGPLGGGSTGTTPTLFGSMASLLRFWQIDTFKVLDHIESFVEYTMQTLDGQFVIIAHGSDQYDAGTSPITHKK